MSDLLPVLQENHPAMSLCQLCPLPGHCCIRFILTIGTFWKDNWEKDAQERLNELGVPFFKPVAIHSEYLDEETKKEYVVLYYSCSMLTDGGRCSIYDKRPECCRRYVPGQDRLCVFHKEL